MSVGKCQVNGWILESVQERVWFWFDDRVWEGPFLGYFLGCLRLSLINSHW